MSSHGSATGNAAWKPWLAAILWTVVIATESSDAFSASHTGRYLYPLLTWLFGPLDPIRYEIWNVALRKTGHVLGYGILCVLFFRSWRVTLQDRIGGWSRKAAIMAWIMTAIVASLDEWHQSYIPSRTGTYRDVVLDSAASLAALLLVFLWSRNGKQPLPDFVAG